MFSNIDIDLRDTLKLVELESTLWAKAQLLRNQSLVQEVHTRPIKANAGRWCFTDGSWKDKDLFSGQGWFSTFPDFDGLLGARNVRACLSPLHSEMEALIWAMKCMKILRQFQVTFATDCSRLVKMVSEPEELPTFESYLEDIKLLIRSFINSEIIHVPRTANLKADSLARSAQNSETTVFRLTYGCRVTTLVYRVNMSL